MSSKAEARTAINSVLANAPTFHPSNVDLFTDWTLQGGDIVTVYSENEPYNVPIFGLQYKWNGSSKLTASSSGNEYRDSLENMAKKEYSRKGNSYRGGVRNAEQNQIWGNEFYSEDGALHSIIVQTTTYIMSAVENVASDLHSFILQTPEMIHAEVGSAVSGFAHSVIEQTATYIRTEVSNAASAISASVIEQTTEYVRSEVVSVASGIAWSVIEQTMTGIITEVGRKSRVFIQPTDPVLTGEDVHEKDIWVQSNSIRTWNGLAGSNWNSRAIYKWRQYYGAELWVRNNGAWEKIGDSSTPVEQEVKIVHNEEEYSLLGHKVDIKGEVYDSKLQVTAQAIRGEVSTAGSKIYSVIEQTATRVFSGVYNEVEDNFSTIEQTATAINLEVNSAKSSLYSAINVTSTQISLKVGKGEVISSINQTAESITISASKVNLSGYVQATDLTADYLTTKIANFQSLTSERGGISVYSVGTTNFSQGGISCYLPNAIWSLRINQSGNTYTLQRQRYNDDGWTDVGSFSRATQLSGGWSSKKFTVTASPQGNTCYTTLANGSISRSGRTVTIPIKATVDGGATYYDTGHEATGTITVGKSEINAQRGARQTSEPSSDDRVANCSLNGWYVITVSVLGQSKTFKFNVNVE